MEKREYTIYVDGYCCTDQEVAVIRSEASKKEKAALDAIFDELRKGGKVIRDELTEEVLRRIAEEESQAGREILYLAPAENLAQNQWIAQDIPGITVVNTGTLSGGIGILAEQAKKNQEQGMTLQENAEALKESASELRSYLIINDLIYMKKSGVLPQSISAYGTMISMKSVLRMDEGKIKLANKIRGSKVTADYILKKIEEDVSVRDIGTINIYSGKAEEVKNILLTEIRGQYPEVRMKTGELTPELAKCLGPGSIVVSWE